VEVLGLLSVRQLLADPQGCELFRVLTAALGQIEPNSAHFVISLTKEKSRLLWTVLEILKFWDPDEEYCSKFTTQYFGYIQNLICFFEKSSIGC
jgi:hypothetical protein